MRILPVNNYNSQAKPQNNQKQNVNFGLLHGGAELSAKCRRLAHCSEAESFLHGFLGGIEHAQVIQKGPVVELRGGLSFEKVQTFTLQDIEELRRLKQKARDKNVLVAPGEVFGIYEKDYGTKPTATLLQEIETQLDAARPIDPVIQAKLTELEPHATVLDDIAWERNPEATAKISDQQRHIHMDEEERIIQEIAQISMGA